MPDISWNMISYCNIESKFQLISGPIHLCDRYMFLPWENEGRGDALFWKKRKILNFGIFLAWQYNKIMLSLQERRVTFKRKCCLQFNRAMPICVICVAIYCFWTKKNKMHLRSYSLTINGGKMNNSPSPPSHENNPFISLL